jgi:hypothetical protein
MMIPPSASKVLILLILFASVVFADDFKTVSGKEYKNATVIHEEPDGIMIKFSGGIVKIPCAEMTQADQQRFRCDLQKAAAYSAAQAAGIQQANQQVESNQQRKEVEQQKALQNRVSELQQQDKRLVEPVRQAEIGTAGQQAASRADIQRFEDEAQQETLGQPRVSSEIWRKGGKEYQYAERQREYEGGEDRSNSTPLKLKHGSSTTVR